MAEVAARLNPGAGAGVIAGSPVDRLTAALRNEASAAEYNGWASAPFGRLTVAALRHMALHGPARCEGDSVAVQYGVTPGLPPAADLLTDPSSVLPGLFESAPSVPDAFAPVYSTSPDELFDMEMGENK